MQVATATAGNPVAVDLQEILRQHTPLVQRMANHLMARLPSSVQLGDLVQAGLIGLVEALSRYAKVGNVPFEAYALRRIRGAMVDELRAGDWVPRRVRRNRRRIEAALTVFEQQHGRSASEVEGAEATGVGLAQYRKMLAEADASQLLFLEDLGYAEGGGYLDRCLPDTDADPYACLSDSRFRSALIEAIERLPERERQLMSMYYERDLNFKEIATVFDVTESRVCQVHAMAVSRLRRALRGWTA